MGAETRATLDPDDGVTFTVSRGFDDTAGTLTVFYRIGREGPDGPAAIDPIVNRARADYWVLNQPRYLIGMAADPVTLVGSLLIPAGAASASITVVPLDDRTVEWDESIVMELISWDEYRRLFDRLDTVTPAAGNPSVNLMSRWWDNRSPYRLARDEAGQPVGERAVATLLDNDRLETRSIQQPDYHTTGLVAHTVEYGWLAADTHAGHARVTIPVWSPTYREDDNLLPIVEVVLQLPETEAPLTRLIGSMRVAGIAAQAIPFDTTDLPRYLREHPHAALRLVLMGPESLAQSLPSGYYDYDVVVTAHWGTVTARRTARGGMTLINRADPQWGSREFGRRWWIDELDRIVPADGVTYVSQPSEPSLAERERGRGRE